MRVPSPADLRADVVRPVAFVRAGIVDYLDAWQLQRALSDARRREAVGDTLLLLEHPRVYTMGKRTDPAHVLWDESRRRTHGIDLIEVDRGGDVTYHGPGQLVGYPVVRLASIRSVVGHVRALEEVLIRALAGFGVRATRLDDFTGVWVDDAKIAAIGVRVASGGITSHGFALNVTTDLNDYAGIVPCGIADRSVCSLAGLGVDVDIDTVADAVADAFAEVFDATLESTSLQVLRAQLDATLDDPHADDRRSKVPV